MKKIVLYIAVFCFTFIVTDSLFNKKDNEYDNNMGDQSEKSIVFDELTIENDRIVLKENDNAYYVAYFEGSNYKVYKYMFLDNKENYIENYIQYIANVVNYDYDKYMLKLFINEDNGNYDEIIKLLRENESLEVIY